MTTVLITDREDSSYVSCEHGGVRGRLVARLRAWTLDSRLADGACPDSSAGLSLRAEKLIDQRTRRQVASELQHLVRTAQRSRDPLDRGLQICRTEVLHAREELEEIAYHLLSSEPVDARGVARVRLLLRDGSSPVYRFRRRGELEQALQEALEALRLPLSVDV